MSADYSFEFVGGALCLDFVNTVGARGPSGSRNEHLNDYSDLIEWARQGGMISDARAKQLAAHAACKPTIARRVLGEALELREAIAGVSSPLADRHKPAPADVAAINAALPRALAHLEIIPSDHGFDWRFRE